MFRLRLVSLITIHSHLIPLTESGGGGNIYFGKVVIKVDYEKMGMRVRQQRTLRGMTQGELADKVGVSTSFIGHIERGEKKASVETIVALCNAMEVSPSALLQDSLSNAVMQSQMSLDEDSKDLMNGLMQVLREHTERKEYR